jgi:hypothetical protein
MLAVLSTDAPGIEERFRAGGINLAFCVVVLGD